MRRASLLFCAGLLLGAFAMYFARPSDSDTTAPQALVLDRETAPRPGPALNMLTQSSAQRAAPMARLPPPR